MIGGRKTLGFTFENNYPRDTPPSQSQKAIFRVFSTHRLCFIIYYVLLFSIWMSESVVLWCIACSICFRFLFLYSCFRVCSLSLVMALLICIYSLSLFNLSSCFVFVLVSYSSSCSSFCGVLVCLCCTSHPFASMCEPLRATLCPRHRCRTRCVLSVLCVCSPPSLFAIVLSFTGKHSSQFMSLYLPHRFSKVVYLHGASCFSCLRRKRSYCLLLLSMILKYAFTPLMLCLWRFLCEVREVVFFFILASQTWRRNPHGVCLWKSFLLRCVLWNVHVVEVLFIILSWVEIDVQYKSRSVFVVTTQINCIPWSRLSNTHTRHERYIYNLQ